MYASEDLETGKLYLQKGQSARALPFLRKAYMEDATDPERQSFYGLVNALELGQVNMAMELCEAAVRKLPDNDDFLYNLSFVYLKAGRKKEGYDALERGMKINPDHPAAETIRQKLGIRRIPVLRFLSRANPVNKYLGIFACRLDRMQKRLQGQSA